MKRKILYVILPLILVSLAFSPELFSHCEIPCGIYDDLTLLHEILFYAMRTKQTTDVDYTGKLRSLVEDFSQVYFQEHGHTH